MEYYDQWWTKRVLLFSSDTTNSRRLPPVRPESLHVAGNRRMTLPSPGGLSNVEIESAHTPVPRGGSGRSPTGEVVGPSPRREPPGKGVVTLKRKGSSDVVRQSHARSASAGSCTGDYRSSAGDSVSVSVSGSVSSFFGGLRTPSASNLDSISGDHPLCTIVPAASPTTFEGLDSTRSSSSGRERSGSGGSGKVGGGSWGGSVSSIVSLEDAAQRIAVDPDSGHSYFVERPTVCDACPYCEDVCEVAWCNGCDEQRLHLEDAYGELILSTAELESNVGGRIRKDGRVGGDGMGIVNNGRKLAPVLSRRYPRKAGYTLCEIRRRKLTGACWVVCEGSVYDVTGALEDHPGGKRSILRNAGGRDCEEDFHFHSKAAKKQWRQYRIGSLLNCSGETGDAAAGDEDGERTMRSGSDCVIS